MSDLAKAYEAKSVDTKWYDFWDKHHFFKADSSSKKPPYCIVIPPPNVTGVLHMGHALVNTLQDILVRWKRMSGFETLWVPGTDHAGIATQAVVERHLLKTQNKKRSAFSREEFLTHVWDWKEKSESRILNQLKRIGSSCDWSRLRFTMDEGNNRSVRCMFKKLFDQGLIYRGDYLVNWDPVTQTALADDEVEYEEQSTFLWHIRYPLADSSDYVVVATTRPETMLGDTAVAVSPGDARYTTYLNQQICLPITGRLIPFITDHHVDPAFGTGVVKVTPAHDPNDYQMGIRYRLPMINIMTPDGKINENGGEFAGLTMQEARQVVVEKLKALGLIEKIEPHQNRVGLSYRSKAIIEPYLSKQWFVKMEHFAKKMHEIVSQKETRLCPSHWESTYFHWIDHLRDWCISRQIWWGHRIPIWYNKNNPDQMICYAEEGLPEEVQKNPEEWVQDADVLDTWFSSALWPFATLGWPDSTADLKKFYPNATLITGHDILFFWVARMLAMGDFAMGEVPFPETFLHGLIYGKSYWRNNAEGGITYVTEEEQKAYDLGKPLPKDVHSKWEKMSKSKGNIIDPLEMIDQYGTDAVRMALCASATQARQIDLDRRRFEEFKNFTNKVWNGARFVLINLQENESQGLSALTSEEFVQGINNSLLALEDRWILSTLNRTVKEVHGHLEKYEFDQAALKAYDFFWKEFCAYYVEICKPILFGKAGTPEERKNKQKILLIVLCQAVRLLHPITPFITEELFQSLKNQMKDLEHFSLTASDSYTKECVEALQSPACIVAPYPSFLPFQGEEEKIEAEFSFIEQVVYTIRNIRGEMKLSPGTATDIYVIGQSVDPQIALVKQNSSIIKALVRTQNLSVDTLEPDLKFSSAGNLGNIKIILPLPEDLIQQETNRLEKEKEKALQTLKKLEEQLSNQEFVEKAPAPLVEKLKEQLMQAKKVIESIEKKI